MCVPLCNNQFDFRAHKGVSHGLSLLNDLMCFSADHRFNMFICSLDAEQYFDSIWHDGLSINSEIYLILFSGVFCTIGTQVWKR